jgi:pyruvate kinase
MLSGESAMGKYPVDAVAMLAKIAEAIEPHRPAHGVREALKDLDVGGKVSLADLIAFSVETTLERISPAVVFVPTRSGYTARSIARFRLPVWIAAVSSQETTCQGLQFSYGVYPVHEPEHPEDWNAFARQWLQTHGVEGDLVILTEGPSSKRPETNNRMEIIDLRH